MPGVLTQGQPAVWQIESSSLVALMVSDSMEAATPREVSLALYLVELAFCSVHPQSPCGWLVPHQEPRGVYLWGRGSKGLTLGQIIDG